ncbi:MULTISPECIES: AAA family ATPase [unclassified Bradyrhizobium]|uniref:AAA family ATPase n=1 Tax=unclassified Bradyrhizobium TaxID=2631580 RepID=UPI001FF945DC|nr:MULTISPECIES: AAA family ATPase [unclassified Bradyrhizobium]MCK1536448.1 AAA family ATPase [Bradyrhizobium sp. 176]MCK1556517.1 AAA family ATPase [Bradyrhizobium sp. 171]
MHEHPFFDNLCKNISFSLAGEAGTAGTGMASANRLKSLKVSQLRDHDNLAIEFHPDINFIIGRNGTGKTTVMNLVSAMLGLNPEMLGRLPFRQAVLTLESIEEPNRRLEVSVEKLSTPEMKRPEIVAKVRDGGEQIEFDFDYVGDGRYLRYDNPARRRSAEDAIRYNRFLSSRVRFSWLPIQRAEVRAYVSPEERDMNPLDRKIRQIVVDMTKYLSSLDTKATSIINQFQQEYFLSMLDYSAPATNELVPIQQLQQSLFSIFDEFNVPRPLYRKRIESHLRRLQSDENSESRRLLSADTARLYTLALKWQEFDQRRADIYRPKDEFVGIFNRLFLNKSFAFDERNQPSIASREASGRRAIDLDELSSGEKQMLIIIGETLLQEQNNFVFLADEPELSLHIEWQKDLVQNIRKLNPHCQIVFATHSPDIVERYGDRTLDLENFTSIG